MICIVSFSPWFVLSQRHQASYVPRAASSRDPANAVVALVTVLGPGNVAIPATHLTTHGPKEPKPAKISSQVIECVSMFV